MRLLGTLPTWRIVQLSQRAPDRPLPHSSSVSQWQFFIILFSKRRAVVIPSIRRSSSASCFAGQRTPAL